MTLFTEVSLTTLMKNGSPLMDLLLPSGSTVSLLLLLQARYHAGALTHHR